VLQSPNLFGHAKSVGFMRAGSQPDLRFRWVRAD
jgi:hypothetical protein